MNRWIFGAVLLLIIVAGGSYFYYAYTTAQHKKAAAELDEFVRQWEKDQQAHPKSSTEPQETSTDIPAESDTPQNAEKHITNATVTKETAATHGQTGAAAEKAETADVRVSPHGFGPYPEVPEDYPAKHNVEWGKDDREMELLHRVLIKLWTSGEKNFLGGSIQDGKVYPHYYDTVYIGIKETRKADGVVSRTTERLSGPFVQYSLQELEENPPPHIRILDLETSGIDPYQYLDLP